MDIVLALKANHGMVVCKMIYGRRDDYDDCFIKMLISMMMMFLACVDDDDSSIKKRDVDGDDSSIKKKDIDDDDSSIKRCRCPHSAGVLTDQVRPRLSHRLGPGYPSSSSSSSSSSLSLSITIESHGFIETNWS